MLNKLTSYVLLASNEVLAQMHAEHNALTAALEYYDHKKVLSFFAEHGVGEERCVELVIKFLSNNCNRRVAGIDGLIAVCKDAKVASGICGKISPDKIGNILEDGSLICNNIAIICNFFDEAVVEEIAGKNEGAQTQIFICTRQQMIDFIIHIAGNSITQLALTSVSGKNKSLSAKTLFANYSDYSYPMLYVCLASACLLPVNMMVLFFVGLNALFCINILFKIYIFLVGFAAQKKSHKVFPVTNLSLPTYCVMVPLFKESKKVVQNNVKAMTSLNYPKDKIQVQLIVEESDVKTQAVLKELSLPSYFDVITVKKSFPQTKPKACNFALQFTNAKHLVIFDAEDKPHKDQLRIAVSEFVKLPKDFVCLQAKLNYYNRNSNMLTKFFSIEYGLWFNYMIPALAKLNMVIPLGGTSNHFKTDFLKKVGAWDAFNVTEDADLGVRISMQGGKVGFLDSNTMEEAPNRISSWIKQRSRWIKGYMQTYIVHNRPENMITKRLNLSQLTSYYLLIGFTNVCFVSTPVLLFMWLFLNLQLSPYYFLLQISTFVNVAFTAIMLIGGSILLAVKNRWNDAVLTCALFPCYFVLHSVASYLALYELFVSPFSWRKTEHGHGQQE